MLYLRIVNEAEEFSIITCCDYTHFNYLIDPDLDESIDDLWIDEFISSLNHDSGAV